MRRLLFIIQKEFIQILRNKAILPLITVIPVVQLIVLSYAANNEVKNVNVAIVDQDQSTYSQRLIGKVQASNRFTLIEATRGGKLQAVQTADRLMQNGEADVVLVIPPDFEKDFLKQKSADVQMLVNAINGQQATVGASYLTQIIQQFNQEIQQDAAPRMVARKANGSPQIQIENANWFNPELDYKHFMVPGILGDLVTILVMLLTAINVVREREIGTIEQINVTPIKKWQFILGKMIPFLLIGLLLMSIGLIAGKLIFNISIEGSLFIVFAYCALNLSAVLGLGLFISNLADTQQQAIFIAFFFVIVFVLMSGLFTPIESMPPWAQWLTVPNPIAHFVDVMRSVLLKGSTLSDVAHHFWITGVLVVIFNTLAVVSYRKVA